ncbi:NADH:flavin oxidoreductase/NADH oxidase [Sinomonas sp. P47F7]|uniref:NADH:flavin oxidoreductase/NADH oxidase n=1 Tax=Sinomonas sp. P47F7 TaxID=3410987 RepID=UPI003BF5D36A
MTSLFEPLQLRGVTVPNRAWMSPMCTYSAVPDEGHAGRPHDFHLAHYASRAAGGLGLVAVEATGVAPEGRITAHDLGLWDDAQIPAFARLTSAIRAAGAVPAIQLAHAGRKASSARPWSGGGAVPVAEGGWETVGPSAVAFPGHPVPAELSREGIARVVEQFAEAARRALEADFDAVEIHGAHGYLLHSFLSPVSNRRTDEYGGSLENRARLALEVLDAVRRVWPENRPVFLRVSTTDWIHENPEDPRESWTVNDAVRLAGWAAQRGADLVDCSSGGIDTVPVPADRDYQTRYAAIIRAEAGVPVAAVGRIADPEWANQLIEAGSADAVFLGRALLRDASWANNAAAALGAPGRFIQQYDYVL